MASIKEHLISTFQNLHQLKDKLNNPIVLFSGGLDSSYLVLYLIKELRLKPLIVRIDVGQSDLSDIDTLQSLELKGYLIDAREELVQSFIPKLLKNGGLYGKSHFLSASLTRPLFIKKAIEFSNQQESNCIIHGAIPSQNSLRRFNQSLKDLNFSGFYGSPFTDDDKSRKEKTLFLESHGIKVSEKRSYSIDTNLFCREFEAGQLCDIKNFTIPESQFLWTRLKTTTPTDLRLTFHRGALTHINDQPISLEKAISELNVLVGSYGLGRQVGLEENPLSTSIEVRECPSLFILSQALYDLQSYIFPRSLIERKIQMEQRWTTLASEGHWFSLEKQAIEAYTDTLLEKVGGTVQYNLSRQGIVLNGLQRNA